MIELSGQAGLLEELRPRIRVVGVGGAGGNAVANMIRDNVPGVEFVVANTDAQALRASPADRLLQLGRRTTEGLGAGSRAEVGKAAAEESLAEIKRMLDGAHMCFIAAGLGGGTGTGAAPVIAEASRAMGILTVAVVTRPFGFEGSRRAKTADAGLEALAKHVDTLIVIPNQNLFRIANAETSFKAAFDLADQVLQQGVRGITDLMTAPGLVNLDFADVRTVMAGMGKAMMGSGEASGEARAARAAEQAMANPLLDEAIKGARGLIISISGGEDMRLMEVDEAATRIKALVDPEADIIWGSAFLPELEGRIRVSIVATGIDSAPVAEVAAPETVATAAVPVRPAFAASHVPAAAAQAPVQTSLPLPEPRPTRGALLTAAAPGASMTAAKPAEQEAPPSPFLAAAREEQELLLTVERRLILPPAESAEPDDEEPIHGRRETARGPSLFERVATAARGVVIRRVGDTSPIAPVVRDSVFLGRRAA